MNTVSTNNQKTKLSQVRDDIIVSEVPVFNVMASTLSNDRVIDTRDLGMSEGDLKNLPSDIKVKLNQVLVPIKATKPLKSIIKAVQNYLNRFMVEQKPFGYVCGHEVAGEREEFLLKKQREFYDSILDEDLYVAACQRIITDLTNDEVLKKLHWHGRLIEMAKAKQPCYEDYVDKCELEVLSHYIGESGRASTNKLKTAQDVFPSICKGVKGKLVSEISQVANEVMVNITKQTKKDSIQEKSWVRSYELCDKLKSLAFVSSNISVIENEIRSMLNSFLPKSGTITGQTKTNFLTLIGALLDPFVLADKVDNGEPLFKKEIFSEQTADLIKPVMDNEVVQEVTTSEISPEDLMGILLVDDEVEEAQEIEPLPLIIIEEAVEEIQVLPMVTAKEIQVTLEELEAISDEDPVATSADEFIDEFNQDQAGSIDELEGDDLLSALGF
jgi:hypothetical protein